MKYDRIIELDLGYQNIQKKKFQKASLKNDRVGATTFGIP